MVPFMSDSTDFVGDWPGKSPLEAGGISHPAVYHMLDVAAVAERLIARFALRPPLRDALVFLTAVHDLGKVNAAFRSMLRDGVPQGQGRHWEVTEAYLCHFDKVLGEKLGSRDTRRKQLHAATAGHHGRPPNRDERGFQSMLNAASPAGIADAGAVLATFLMLWPDASLEGLSSLEHAKALSWWLPGLVSAADWIGSNPIWFPAHAPDLTVPAYLDHTRRLAVVALREAGLDSPAVGAGQLFDFRLRPMQSACGEIALPCGPTLAVIEDETGAGKTEAALILAQRMMQAGKGRGLFFALPTMAIADAMFARAADAVGKMFAGRPSVTLAHGRSGLSEGFRDLSERPVAGDDIVCSPWLADNRRRALLADVGVGTIDQALLAVLPTKFATLRHFGLSSKILIVDEVHELGEPYVAVVLEQLLRAHRMAGGSAILLTATLPLNLRRKLIEVYAPGQAEADPAYPALTIAGGAARRDLPTGTGPRGPVKVERLGSAAAAVTLLAAMSAKGAACVWVRNAVDDAIAGVEALRAAGVDADLFHARFALCDRKRIEGAVLGRFGKTGQGRDRVLVATQVIQASLDLDFDVMVSDLAPMADLIQRAGRLWRHMDLRPSAGRPVPAPVLHVVSPDPLVVEDGHWLNRVLDAGAFVYPHDLQWRTAERLFAAGQIVAPAGLRALIEAVHGEGLPPVPEVLQKAENAHLGERFAKEAQGWQNCVKLEDGYRMGGGAAEDAEYPTRLGQPQKVLVLARRIGGRLVPWAKGADGWALSEVMASLRKLAALPLPDQTSPEVQAVRADWPKWQQAVVCVVGEGGLICEGLRYDPDRGLIFGST